MVKTAFVKHYKRYIISSVVTFSGVFLLTAGTELKGLTDQAITGSLLLAILVTGARAGLKALVELAVSWYRQK